MWWFATLALAGNVEHKAGAQHDVDIEAFCGNVTLVGARTDKVSVQGEAAVDHGPGRTRIGSSGMLGIECLDITVTVPREARIDVEGVSVSVTARDLAGRLSVETVSGTIEVGGTEGPRQVEIESVSGSVRVHSGVGGELELATVSGSIAVTGGPFAELEAGSVSGSIAITAVPTESGRVEVEAHSGSVHLSFDRTPQRLDAHTASGSIANGLTTDRPTSDPMDHTLRITADKGPVVSVETFSGSITLSKESK